jgi:hypothetical protein
MGFLDDAFGEDTEAFEAELRERARHLARDPEFRLMLREKHETRLDDEYRRFVFKGNPPPRRNQAPIEAAFDVSSWVLSKGGARADIGVASVP